MLTAHPLIEVVGAVQSGAAALQFLSTTSVDVMLLDLRMPVMNGVQVLKELKHLELPTRAIMLTSFETDEDIYQSIQAGAYGYLSKEAGLDIMVEAIRTVHSGRHYIRGEIAARLAARMIQSNLTSRELEILRMVAQGLTNKDIGSALRISSFTVKNHINSILAKLEVCDRTEAATAAISRGIIEL